MGFAASSIGCVDNNTSIFIRQVQVPDPDNGCIVSADPSALMDTHGNVDTFAQRFITGAGDVTQGQTAAFNVSLLVGNQLIRRGDVDTLKVETSRVQLFEAEVEVFDFQGASLNTFSQPISGFIDPSNGSEPGYGLTGLTVIDAGTIAAAGNQTLVARVQIFGESLGGLEVETGFWDYPVTVCDGCFGCVEPSSCDDEIVATCQLGQNAPDCRCLDRGFCPPNLGPACF